MSNPNLWFTIYEDKEIVALLDIHPISKGHTLIIPKKHAEDIFEMPKETLARISEFSKDVSIVLREKLGAEGVSIFQMNGRAADQEEMHYHVHVVPPMRNDWFHKVMLPAGKKQDEITATARELSELAKILSL